MTTNPFANALIAAGYISILASVLFNAQMFNDQELGMMAPIIVLSTLVLSAALMGYLFFYQPVRLMIEGKPQEAAKFLLTTVAWFAGITAVVIAAWCLISALMKV